MLDDDEDTIPLSHPTESENTSSHRPVLQKKAYRIAEFCKVYGVSRSHVYNEIKSGRLKSRKRGCRLIGVDDAENWFNRE